MFDDVTEILPPLPNVMSDEQPVRFQCNCHHYSGNPCSSMFSSDEFEMIRCCYLEMTREELDIAILAQLSCGMHLSERRKKEEGGQSTCDATH